MTMRHILSKFIPGAGTLLTNVQDGDSQPNAVDLRVDKIFSLNNEVFEISESEKKHRGSEEVLPVDGYFELEPGTYEILMENIVNIPEGYAGWVITRSTLNRNGLFITLYCCGTSLRKMLKEI